MSQQQQYDAIMGTSDKSGVEALSSRLASFRQWIQRAGCTVHPAIAIVNGEATDGTKNAPVMILDTSQSSLSSSQNIQPSSAHHHHHQSASLSASHHGISNNAIMGGSKGSNNGKPQGPEGRGGLIDREEDRTLYDRTIGCQVRTTREIKEDQVMMTVPRSIMIHPDLIAASDAGRVVLACSEPPEPEDTNTNHCFWDAFGNTAAKEKYYQEKNAQGNGPQLLIKILQERKRVETAFNKAIKKAQESSSQPEYKLAKQGAISTRAAVLCFILQQRFSNEENPPIALPNFIDEYSTIPDATTSIDRITPTADTPDTFGPYARTLPPAIPLPICWKRNELALLANCISGLPLLIDIASQIMTLADDFISLLEAGILYRFPHLFTPDMLTWDRWLWAASVHASRILPATCYLNKGEKKASEHQCSTNERFYSPPEIWDELGVMIPLIDMLNHESNAAQIRWDSPNPNPTRAEEELMDMDYTEDDNETDKTVAKVVVQKRVKKGLQIYTNYGIESNKELIFKYGFAQMVNSSDTASIGWGLSTCVGKMSRPNDYTPIDFCSEEEMAKDEKYLVYESTDADEIQSWWTEKRLRLLESQIESDNEFWTLLRSGKKMTATAHSDGTFDPILLTAVVAASMPSSSIERYVDSNNYQNGDKSKEEIKSKITITKRHQRVIRKYLLFLFCRKLEKLLASLDKGLGNQFGNVKLWTKVAEDGLKHKSAEETGWFSFFDSFAYAAAMEVEKGCFYSMAPDSCVLTLYDGHLRALQTSIECVISQSKFEESVLKQLEDLDFVISNNDDDDKDQEELDETTEINASANNSDNEKNTEKDSKDESSSQKQSLANGATKSEVEKKERRRNRRSRGKGGGNGIGQAPSALKLHIGNLSYQTPPSRLFDFFASQYGRENVLECHIPTERETGKSRGFGFVTMPEAAARRVLADNLSPQIDGRVVKIAESNTTARTNTNGLTLNNTRMPNMPGFPMQGGPMPMMGGLGPGMMPPPDDIYGPGPLPPGMDPYYNRVMNPEFDPRRRRSRSWNRGRSYSRSPSPRYRRNEARHHDRNYRDRSHRSYSRSRSRSRSYSRGRDRRDRDRRDRDRDWDRGSSRRRSSRGSRRSSRYSRSRSVSVSRSRSRSRSRNRSRSRSRSPSYSKKATGSRRERNRERKSSGGNLHNAEDSNLQSRNGGRSESASPAQNREADSDANVKESGKSSRRTRSKSRERNSRSRKRHKGSRRNKEKRHTSHSPSRSRSF